MDIRVTVGGVEAVVTVRDAAEAASLLSQLAAIKPESQRSIPVAQTTPFALTDDSQAIAVKGNQYSQDSVRNALLGMKGKPVARFLVALLGHPNGATDDVVKDALKLGDDQHLGPQVSNVSKVCKKYGIPKESIVISQSKRLSDGTNKYRFKLTEQAARIIRSIDNFDDVVDFDEAMT